LSKRGHRLRLVGRLGTKYGQVPYATHWSTNGDGGESKRTRPHIAGAVAQFAASRVVRGAGRRVRAANTLRGSGSGAVPYTTRCWFSQLGSAGTRWSSSVASNGVELLRGPAEGEAGGRGGRVPGRRRRAGRPPVPRTRQVRARQRPGRARVSPPPPSMSRHPNRVTARRWAPPPNAAFDALFADVPSPSPRLSSSAPGSSRRAGRPWR
jgi:hypothetical protein